MLTRGLHCDGSLLLGEERGDAQEKPGGEQWRRSVSCWASLLGKELLLVHMTETAGGNSPDALLFTTEDTGPKSSQVASLL